MNLATQLANIRLIGSLRQHKADALHKTSRNRCRPSLDTLEDRKLLAAQSVNIAIIGDPLNSDGSPVINGGFLPTTGADLAGFSFTAMAPANVNSGNLAAYDTVVLNVASRAMSESVNTLTPQQKADLVSFVGSGGKLIIYDSEAPTQDYSWLPYQFTTSNPGPAGANGTLSITEENTLSSANPTDPKYIDANYLSTQTDAVGDGNVFTSFDSHWCADMAATNTQNVTGPVHTYASYSTSTSQSQGLFIYNGLDLDYMGYETSPNGLRKIWIQELAQSFNPAVGLPCATPVTGIQVAPASAVDQFGRPHTLTATLKDLLGTPQVGVTVTFTVTAGPNMGAVGTYSPVDQKTDANGEVTFTYVGNALGTDTIEASFVNPQSQTITSQPVTMTWVATASPPNSVDKTFYTHFDTTLMVPAPGVLSNDTDPDPEHVLSAILVTGPTHGALTLNPDGSFAYIPNDGFVGNDSFQYVANDGYDNGNLATVTLTVFPRLGIQMDPASDSGQSNSDQITNVSRPIFMGLAEVGSQVQVFVTQAGNPTPVLIGQATPDAQGRWSVTATTALPDGTYMVQVAENHPSQPARESETSNLANPIVIDTVGPRITNLAFKPSTGQLTPTIQDDRSGLNQMTLADPANYKLVKFHTPAQYRLMVNSASPATPPDDPTAAQTVTIAFVDVKGGTRFGAGYYMAQIRSGGLADVAGNELDGEFSGKAPTGNGTPGGDAQAFLVANSNRVQNIKAVTPYVQSLFDRRENITNETKVRLKRHPKPKLHNEKVVVQQAARPQGVLSLAPFAGDSMAARKHRHRKDS